VTLEDGRHPKNRVLKEEYLLRPPWALQSRSLVVIVEVKSWTDATVRFDPAAKPQLNAGVLT
jgi:hypothetical protein